MRTRDAFVVVTSAWVSASLFGALPYLSTGTLGPIDALFESTSGFTTTGSTVLRDVGAVEPAVLLWRSLTQWLGGKGIIVFTVAVLPLMGIGGMQLLEAEAPGPVTDKLTPRVADTARVLWIVYVGLTAAAFFALWIAGMGPFDALCHALTALDAQSLQCAAHDRRVAVDLGPLAEGGALPAVEEAQARLGHAPGGVERPNQRLELQAASGSPRRGRRW